MVNNVSFTGIPCLVKAYKTAWLIDVNKYMSSANLSAGCEHGLAGREKHKTVKCTNAKCSFIHQTWKAC